MLATTTIDGRQVAYDLLGDTGTPIVVTPGGRFDMEVPGLRALADALVDRGYRVLLWDRPNCGRSEMRFDGRTESHMRAGVLANLIEELSLGPVVIAGGSGGARDSMILTIQRPDLVSRLLLWNIVGGVYSTMSLSSVYVFPSLQAARMGGMEAVMALPEWSQRIADNPRNREVLESMDPGAFVQRMLQWLSAYVPKPDQTIPGVDDLELATVAVPTLIIRGGERDIDHPKRTSYDVHSIIRGSIVVDPPWAEDSWERAIAGEFPIFDPWRLAAPLFDDFVQGRAVAPSATAPH